MPRIIYLDTQDYIKLFNEPNAGPNHQVLTDLLAYRDRGEIVLGFSFATILEFITRPDAANRRERVRRGQLIKDICGPNAFPYPTAIPEGEPPRVSRRRNSLSQATRADSRYC